MQNETNINLDDLVQQIRIQNPQAGPENEESNSKLRQKLEEQLILKPAQVELEQLDLKYIIMNVKRSLCEFQKRIDQSVAEQQIRRTTRVRKTVYQDPAVINFFGRTRFDRKSLPSTIKPDSAPPCSNSNCSHKISELNEIVQVESLPISASSNLLTIFIPSILQERLHSCKYKISIDLNRLDLTKQILDLNLGQVNSSQGPNKLAITPTDKEVCEKCTLDAAGKLEVTCEIKNDMETEKKLQTVGTNTDTPPENTRTTKVNDVQKDEIAVIASESAVAVTVDSDVLTTPPGKKRGRKRSEPKIIIKGPPKKRGRKPGSKNKKKDEKSDIAKYVETFACNAASPSEVSQIVTSTTQNWDMPQQNCQIAYIMNGEWTFSSASSNQLVSTTNNVMNLDEAANGQENFIPFDDFVNFIDNSSFDGADNVIAQVLESSTEAEPTNANVNPPELDAIKFTVEIPLNSKSSLNPEVSQPILSTTSFNGPTESMFKRCDDANVVHSTANDNEIEINNEILDLSKDNNTSIAVGVLDLTRDKDEKNASQSAFDQSFQQADNKESKAVVFSTNRSMPSLDDLDTDLFGSPHGSEPAEKSVIFSTEPVTASFAGNCLGSSNESIADSAIEVERKNTPNDKTRPELMKGMSLLEIEKDIDDSLLDFDNCMDDDLLSLAPSSCFNSPIEDRFAEPSVLKTSETGIRSLTFPSPSHTCCTENYTSTSLPLKKKEDLLKRKDEDTTMLRNFRIPRKSPKENPSDAEQHTPNRTLGAVHVERESTTTSPTVHPGGSFKFLISCSQSSTGLDRNPSVKSPAAAIHRNPPGTTSREDVPKIFGQLCWNFLIDKCSEIFCKHSHQLLEPAIISISLVHLPNDVLHSSYRFIWRHYKLFKFYFPIFCEEYGRRNMRRRLSNMITDCEMQHNCQNFLREIYSALLVCGLNRVNACRFILNRVNGSSSAEIDVLMELIIESGAAMFSSAIEQFTLASSYRFKMKDINALASACLHSGGAELITVLIKCLINVDQVEFVTFRSPELIQILDMIKNSGVGGL